MSKPTLQEVAVIYSQHLVPKAGIWVPDADAVDLVAAARIVHGERWTKSMTKRGFALATGYGKQQAGEREAAHV